MNSNHMTKQTLRANEVVFFEGDIDFHFYIVEKGEIEIFIKNVKGEKVVITVLKPGEIFGEMALLDRKPRSASARALTECTLVKISDKAYTTMLRDLPSWSRAMLIGLSKRLMATNMKLQKMSDEPMPQFLTRPTHIDDKSIPNDADLEELMGVVIDKK